MLTSSSIEKRFEAWLSHPSRGLGPVIVEEIRGSTTGNSNRTLFATVRQGTKTVELVIRMGPENPAQAVFLDYDISRQYRVMELLGRETDIPVTPCRWFELDDHVFGSAFFVMDRVQGEVPADYPPYQLSGFLFDASVEDRNRLWRAAIDTLAKLAKLDWEKAGLAFLQSAPKDSFLKEQLDYFEVCYRTGRAESPVLPVIEKTIQWLRDHLPVSSPSAFVWGDARLSNMIFRDFDVVALMDWEAATIGHPDLNLTDFLVMQAYGERPFVTEWASPRLEGFDSDEDTLRHYENSIGRPVDDFRYLLIFSAFKYIALQQRYFEFAGRSGKISREDGEKGKNGGGAMLLLVDAFG